MSSESLKQEAASEQESTASSSESAESRRRRANQSPRRKRPLRLILKRRLDDFLRVRQMYRLAFVLVPLAGFIYVSMLNGVLERGPQETSVLSTLETDQEAAWQVGTQVPDFNLSSTSVPNATGAHIGDGSTSWSIVQSASAHDSIIKKSIIESGNRTSPARLPNASTHTASTMDVPTVRVTVLARADSMIARARADGRHSSDEAVTTRRVPAAAGDERIAVSTFGRQRDQVEESASPMPRSYVVNEGGSLWRTGRRFIKDEGLLDAFIDSLAANGMDVRHVPAGFTFVVDDLGADGMLVVSERSGETFATHIYDDNVITAVRPSKREVRGTTPNDSKPGVWRSEDPTQTALLD